VRRYVVERPVEREVTLHGERVTIEHRKPVETSVSGHAFEERTVEVHETEEVPVVAKTARVVEEVAIRKEETERTETVRDTVRREEVEVTPPTERAR
jgi:stress response protein YsnF